MVDINKKIIGVLFCISILLVGAVPAIGIPSVSKESPELKILEEELLESYDDNITVHLFYTIGPVSKTFTNVELTKGPTGQLRLLNRYLNRRIFRPMAIFRFVPIIVENISFKIEYKRNLKNQSRYTFYSLNYSAILDESGYIINLTNITLIENKIHKVTVENFSGYFIFFRFRPYNIFAPPSKKIFRPAKFLFMGMCNKITYT